MPGLEVVKFELWSFRPLASRFLRTAVFVFNNFIGNACNCSDSSADHDAECGD
jgi:hypothetical protein